jgi:hypothetical protein
MCGKLSPVVISVSKKMVNDIRHPRMIFFAAIPPEMDYIFQVSRNQPLESLAVLFKTLKKLLFA